MITIQIRGLKKLNKFTTSLPRELNKEINKTNGQFMKDVQKSAKLRAPRATGQLANSIRIKKQKNSWILTVESPYGIFQEEGFVPHFIRRFTHSRVGYRFIDWLNFKGYIGTGQFFMVRKYKPFVTPALEHNLSRLSQKLSNSTKQAISQAAR